MKSASLEGGVGTQLGGVSEQSEILDATLAFLFPAASGAVAVPSRKIWMEPIGSIGA